MKQHKRANLRPLVLLLLLPSLGQHIQLDVRRTRLPQRHDVLLLRALASRVRRVPQEIRDAMPPRDGAVEDLALSAQV